MGPVEVEISMSVDGFITGPNEDRFGDTETGQAGRTLAHARPHEGRGRGLSPRIGSQ